MTRQAFWVLGYVGRATPSVAESLVRNHLADLDAWITIETYLHRDQATDRMAEETQSGLWQEVAVVERILTCAVKGSAIDGQPSTSVESESEG